MQRALGFDSIISRRALSGTPFDFLIGIRFAGQPPFAPAMMLALLIYAYR
jgi:hypothetical protein